ncbi:hypothetical protein EJC49_03845 [Aquibium carbonis]|uniref:Uncharacterized protein n=1 Tax=Aquibium carbonis TaxID=2495581 RepID=A0A429Z219_9HYPH|nr:hypothetical protein [Aquibium carbonis]RST87752.1 hypothetical protein EJC49_03845 [Aquibium carbonis]
MDAASSGAMGPSGGDLGKGWGWTPPLAWVALTMLLAASGVYSTLPHAWNPSLPAFLTTYLQASLGVSVVNILWGGWILAAAHSRSRALRRGFLAWQSFNIVAVAASVGYTGFVAEFVTTASSVFLPLMEFAVGIALIVYARRLPDAPAPAVPAPVPATAGRKPSAALYLVNGVIGGIVGAILGGVAGFPFGALLADVLDISCFEGGCGYFAAAIGLLLILVGLVAGIVVAVMRTRRAARRPPA